MGTACDAVGVMGEPFFLLLFFSLSFFSSCFLLDFSGYDSEGIEIPGKSQATIDGFLISQLELEMARMVETLEIPKW